MLDKKTIDKMVAKTALSGGAWEKSIDQFLKIIEQFEQKADDQKKKAGFALLSKIRADLSKEGAQAKKEKDKSRLEIIANIEKLLDKEEKRIDGIKPTPEPAKGKKDDDDDDEAVDPADEADAQREKAQLKALLQKAKRMEMSFAVVIGSSEEDTSLSLHRKMPGKRLFTVLKKNSGIRKGSFGKATLESGVLTLQCLRDLPGGATAAKKIKLSMKADRMPVKRVRILDATGAVLDEDGDDDAPEQKESASTQTDKATNPDNKPSPKGHIKWGSKGDPVLKIQTVLKKLGYYKLKLDGIFGKGTYAAVQAFQKANGLTVDGVVGPKTLTALAAANKGTGAPQTGGAPGPKSSSKTEDDEDEDEDDEDEDDDEEEDDEEDDEDEDDEDENKDDDKQGDTASDAQLNTSETANTSQTPPPAPPPAPNDARRTQKQSDGNNGTSDVMQKREAGAREEIRSLLTGNDHGYEHILDVWSVVREEHQKLKAEVDKYLSANAAASSAFSKALEQISKDIDSVIRGQSWRSTLFKWAGDKSYAIDDVPARWKKLETEMLKAVGLLDSNKALNLFARAPFSTDLVNTQNFSKNLRAWIKDLGKEIDSIHRSASRD